MSWRVSPFSKQFSIALTQYSFGVSLVVIVCTSHFLLTDALVPGGVLHGYVPILKDLEKQLAKALHFIQAHVELLESYNEEEPMEAEGNAVFPSADSATAGNQLSNVAGK